MTARLVKLRVFVPIATDMRSTPLFPAPSSRFQDLPPDSLPASYRHLPFAAHQPPSATTILHNQIQLWTSMDPKCVYDLSSIYEDVWDQGDCDVCMCYATGQLLTMTHRILDPVANLGVVVSPTALVNAQCVSSRVLESFLKTEGLYDEREQAISPLPLHWCAPQNCVKYKVANLQSFWFVDHFAQLLVNHFTQAEQVYPVLGGFKVDKFPSWMASKSSETNPLGPLKVPIRHANHTVLVVGIYIKSHNPLVVHIKFKNTWGKHWGIGGYCWVTTSFFNVLSFPNMDFDAIITCKSFRLEEKKASSTRFSSSQPNSKKAVLAKGSKLEPIMSVQDINIQSQALLNVRDSNKDERERIVVRRFKFEELRLEQIQDLENELMKYFREDLHKRLLSTDFKKQVDGIEMLQRALPSIAKDLIEVLDILIKWFVLLFCESNTSCLLKVLEFLPKLCETLRNEKYTMNESEASIFFPCLVEKTGHKIEKLREKIRELMKQIIHSYSAAKTFPYILEGLRSRNNRTRIECADLVGFLLDNNGSEISGRLKSLQIVASLTAERDGELRKAALNCLATGYKMFGDDLWRYVGKLTEAQRSMIDARFKWKAREMEKRKERKPGEARAALAFKASC